MNLQDIKTYCYFRKTTHNPMEIVRFRKRRGSDDVLTAKFLDGRTVTLKGSQQDYNIFYNVFVEDEYRLKQFKPGTLKTVLDIGANVGLFAAQANRYAERVLSFEPVPDNFSRLQANTANYPNVEAFQLAISDSDTPLILYLPKSKRGSGLYSSCKGNRNVGTDEKIEVPAKPLDEVFTEHQIAHCDLMKIDVEGAEYSILYATSDETFARIDNIHGEYHNIGMDDPKHRIENLCQFLSEKGFQVECCPDRKQANFGLFYARKPA